MKFPELIGGSYTGRSRAAVAERSLNWFPEKIESASGQTKTESVLLPRPGLQTFASLAGLPTAPYTSMVLKVLTSHIPGATYDAIGTVTYGLPWKTGPGALYAGATVFFDGSAWTLRTDSAVIDPTNLNTGAGLFYPGGLYQPKTVAELVVSFYNEGTLSGTSTPPDQLLVYDCWIEASYADGSAWKLRPTVWGITQFTGDVQNPANAMDADQTTYATVERGQFASLGTPTNLQLTGFAPVERLTAPTDPAAGLAGRVLALAELNGRVFCVAQNGASSLFYELHPDGTTTWYAPTLAGDPRPQLCVSQTQVLILSGGLGYSFDLATNTLARITDVDFPVGAVKCDFIDGYFVVLEPASQVFAISALNDGTQWDPLDFADVEGEPGNIVTFIVDHRQLWFLGENHGEIFYDSGDADFPFTRLQGAFFEQGCGAVDSIAKVDNSILWLGRNRDGANIVWRANGYTPQRVSTYAIENLIDSFGDPSDARAYCYQEGGHTFYRLDFPSAHKGLGATLVYDVGENEWHERAYWDATQGVERADLARCHCFAWGKHLVGDYRSGRIYEQSLDYATDAGAAIRRVRAAPDLANGGELMFYSELRLLVQGGVGLDGGVIPGSDPQMILQVSNDGGCTWGQERAVSLGQLGQYAKLVRWRQLGRSRNRAFRLICSEPVQLVIVGADLDVEAGRS